VFKIGIIREGKVPPDSRVPLNPVQCKSAIETHSVEIRIQRSSGRCFTDQEYESAGLQLEDDVTDCEVLLGVKEVPIEMLVPNKTYFFFSHTIKEQAYNRALLQAVLKKNIRLIDYEVLTNAKGRRLIAFGVFAGMVGAHNGLMTFGNRTGQFQLPRMNSFFDYAEAVAHYQTMDWPPIKIVLTGTGRVGKGAAKVLTDMGIKRVEPADFLKQNHKQAVFTQLQCRHYAWRKSDHGFDKQEFYESPDRYESRFQPYFQKADLMINGIYWDNRAPAFFTVDDMQQSDFNLQVVADVTCDIAPVSSIPSTLFASTIADPVFGFDPKTGKAVEPYLAHAVDMMTVDNLPNELPRDASTSFGEQFLEHILPELLKPKSSILDRATVAVYRDLGKHFEYLRGYVDHT